MPNINYRAGRNYEYQRMQHYRKVLGHDCWRSAGSHGHFDLTSVSPGGDVYFIQNKRVDTEAQAKRLIKNFMDRPPLGHRARARYTQVMEVYVKALRTTIEGYV